MLDLIRDLGLRLVDKRHRRLLTAFASLGNKPVTEQELCTVYPGDIKALRDDIRNYAQACERHDVGGHTDGKGGCENKDKHRVCSISINARHRLVWLEQDFASEAIEDETIERFDPIAIAALFRMSKIKTSKDVKTSKASKDFTGTYKIRHFLVLKRTRQHDRTRTASNGKPSTINAGSSK